MDGALKVLGLGFIISSLCFAKIVKVNSTTSEVSSGAVEETSTEAAPPPSRHSRRAPTPRPKLDTKHVGDWRTIYEEARNLLVPDQKYLIQYEEEDSFGSQALNSNGTGSLSTVFSKDDVQEFKKAIDALTEYRSELRTQCPTPSSQSFQTALDKYALGLDSFHRRALPLVADISENNNVLMLLVDRTALRDAAVLTSRYLQYKKQRFKNSMSRFLPADGLLVTSMVTIAKTLKVDITDQDWNRAYALRDSSLELTSLWPRETIYEASQRLGQAQEAVCLVSADSMKAQAAPPPSAPVPAPAVMPSGNPIAPTPGFESAPMAKKTAAVEKKAAE